MPGEFQTERHATTEHRMARWVYNVLLRRPGFMYDRLHTATLLGLSELGFSKVETKFEGRNIEGFLQQPRTRVGGQ